MMFKGKTTKIIIVNACAGYIKINELTQDILLIFFLLFWFDGTCILINVHIHTYIHTYLYKHAIQTQQNII